MYSDASINEAKKIKIYAYLKSPNTANLQHCAGFLAFYVPKVNHSYQQLLPAAHAPEISLASSMSMCTLSRRLVYSNNSDIKQLGSLLEPWCFRGVDEARTALSDLIIN